MNTLKDFTHRILPWIVAGIALVIYLVTLNGWVTMPTLDLTARLNGWHQDPLFSKPLHFVLTWPIRMLSPNAALVGLNVFSAVCAALTIALLARCVSLLPHDRTREQRQRESHELALLSIPLKWVPPLLAGLALALQSTFWENATAPGGETLDLLLFAYAIRCLLEYRVTRNETWLIKLALSYGIGITNNFAMIGFFPLFVVALLWIKGKSFFNFQFILRMVAFGLIGLAFYFILPAVHAASSQSDAGFFEALRKNWAEQKTYLFILPFISAPTLRAHLFMLSLTSIIPLILIGIRWKTFRGETSAAASMITTLMFRVMHIALLVICAWVFFDPKFSGRSLGFGLLPFLTFYFLSALSVGYLAGYVLLVFGTEPDRRWEKASGGLKLLNKAIAGLALLGALAVPAGLIYKNWQPIRHTNGPLLADYSARLMQHLPEKPSIVLSDDADQLLLLQAAYRKAGKLFPHVPVLTSKIGDPEYRDALAKKFPDIQPILEKATGVTLSDLDKVLLLDVLNQTYPLYYLHPSFGYFFERFYAVPHGMNYELLKHSGEELLPPPLSDAVIAENEKFWSEAKNEVIDAFPAAAESGRQGAWIGMAYSRALNNWGVQLQRMNRLVEAGNQFSAALKFNPDNNVATINAKYNEQLRAGKTDTIVTAEELEKVLNLQSMVMNGPFDEPSANLSMGQAFAVGNNLRQAAQNFLRVIELLPNNPMAHIGMVMTYFDMQQPKKALSNIQEIRNNPKIALTEQQELQLIRVESLSYLAQKQVDAAEAILQNAREKYPRNDAVTALLREFQLQASIVLINDGKPEQALKYLNTILKSSPNDPHGLFNRALAYLQLNRLDDAKHDYQQLEKLLTQRSHRVHYGLAEIALRQFDTNEAIKQYQMYLEVAPKDTQEYRQVEEKLKELQGTSR